MEDVRIKIISDDTALDGTAKKLSGLGHVSDENAKKFQEAGEKHAKALKETRGEVERLEDRFRSLGERVVAAFAIERILHFGEECVSAFEESEKAAQQLELAIVKINGGTKESFNKLIEQSERLSKSLNNLYSPKQIQQSQKQLANFGLTSKQIEELIPKILDMASVTGKDLSEATEKSILAINGQTKGLRDVGISFKDTGSKTENLTKLIGNLDKFTGSATATMDTFASKSKEAANQLEILEERLGKKLAPLWEGVKIGALQGAEEIVDFTDALTSGKFEEAINQWNKMGGGVDILAIKHQQELNQYRKLNNKELAETLLSANAFLKTMQQTDEGYDDQIKKVKLLTEAVKERLKPEEDKRKEKIKDDLTLQGEAKLEEARKKKAEAAKKLKEKKFDEKRKEDEELANLEIEAEANKWNKEIKDAEDAHKKKTKIREDEAKEEEKLADMEITAMADRWVREKELRQKQLEDITSFVNSAMDAYDKQLEKQVANIDHAETLQEATITTQQGLAERGLKNDLAFEQKRLAEMEKARMKEFQKMKKAKELETFLNSVAEFSKKDPKTAVMKAIAELALVKGAEAVFMQEGGLLGQNNHTSSGRLHAGGGDILVHAQTGEGILSRREISNLGGADMFLDLKKSLSIPISERGIPIAAVVTNSTAYGKEIVYKLDAIEQTLKGNVSTQIDFDKMHNMIVSVTQNGIKEITKFITPKSRI